ncbi:phage terminase, small subunit [Fructilactobacillus florum DSM 22689 = JCM 16035]|uniref:Phage terminase, small subunit n=1 Tax=Fructilactobacillus florum DSM 22689 = JCM 16035 TaxID=1423745 RepID=A0A0R2CK82_9LACO|nr:phage terminase, small subunit [Fructilactobacillus florum DSM 22689 = JCM 16035]
MVKLAVKPFKSSHSSSLPTTPPKYLGRIAAAAWRKVVRVLNERGDVLVSDEKLVEQYVTQYEIYRHAYEHIKKHGEVNAIYHTPVNPVTGEALEAEFTGFKRNPMTQIYSDAQKNLNTIGISLGLSPKSRKDLSKLLDDDKVDKQAVANSMKEFLR